jgi:hypothetical protein
LAPFSKRRAGAGRPAAAAAAAPRVAPTDRERLQRVLQDLTAARQLLDTAMKDGEESPD